MSLFTYCPIPLWKHSRSIEAEEPTTTEVDQETGQSTPEVATPPEPVDPIKEAEKVKEQGNVAFKASRFQEAIDLYSKAIGVQSVRFRQ